MADISKIRLGEIDYDIKDEVARTLSTQLNNNYLFFKNDKTIMIGDSYLWGSHDNSDENAFRSYGDYFKDLMNISNDNFIKIAEPGAGFCRNGVNGNNFLTLLQNLTLSNNDSVKNVIVCGGFNDQYFDTNTIISSIHNFCDFVTENFINAKIFIGMIANHASHSAYTNRLNIRNNSLISYQYASKYFNCSYLNGIELIMHDYSLFSSDGIHPSEYGQKIIGENLYNCFVSGFTSISTNHRGGNLGDNSNLLFDIFRDNNITTLLINGYITFDSVSTGHNIDLGYFVDNSLFRFFGQNLSINCDFEFVQNDNTVINRNGVIIITQDRIYLHDYAERVNDVIRLNINNAFINFSSISS